MNILENSRIEYGLFIAAFLRWQNHLESLSSVYITFWNQLNCNIEFDVSGQWFGRCSSRYQVQGPSDNMHQCELSWDGVRGLTSLITLSNSVLNHFIFSIYKELCLALATLVLSAKIFLLFWFTEEDTQLTTRNI